MQKENMAVVLHRNLVMNRRVTRIVRAIHDVLPDDVQSLLDVGAGSGEMAYSLNCLRPALHVSGVDTYIRDKSFFPIAPYDGLNLPFLDDAVDVVMLIDVLHHCDDPVLVLKECVRVSRKWILVKDHISDGTVSNLKLRFMDWVGNRAHGVVLPYNYLSSGAWADAIKQCDLTICDSRKNLDLYPGIFNYIFGGRLHNFWLLQKK